MKSAINKELPEGYECSFFETLEDGWELYNCKFHWEGGPCEKRHVFQFKNNTNVFKCTISGNELWVNGERVD